MAAFVASGIPSDITVDLKLFRKREHYWERGVPPAAWRVVLHFFIYS